jgi:adenylate cyclase
MDTTLTIVSQLVRHRLRQDDIARLLATLSADSREEFTHKVADILDKVSALLDISNRVSNTLSLDILLQRLIETTTEAMRAERGSLFLHDAERHELYSRVAQGASVREIRFPDAQGIAGAVFTSGQAEIIPDAYDDPRFNQAIDKQTGYRTRNILCAPIRTRQDEIIGVTQVLNKRHGAFSSDDLTLLEAITSQAAAALRNAQLFEQVQKAREEERQLLEVTTAISTELQLQSLLTKIMETTTTILEAERSSLFIYDAATDELWSHIAQGSEIGEIRIPSHAGIAGTVFTSGDTINIPDAYADPRFNPEIDKRTGYRTRSILCMPLISKEGKITGVTQVLNKKAGVFTSTDERRLKAFSAQASIAIENAKLFDDVLNMRNYNESVLQSLSNGVITLDADRRIVKCNAAALRILHTAADNIAGRTADDFFAVQNTWVLNAINRAAETGKADLFMDTELTLYDGTNVSVHLTAVPLPDIHGTLIGTMLVFEDITSEKRIKSTFGRYLSKEVVEALLHAPDGLKMGGEMREVTFLVSDLRGFTSLVSRSSPHEIVSILNRYLERMVDIIAYYRGTVDEFQGDGILAFFGAPLAAHDDPERAVACAIAMQRALVEINAEQRQRNLPELAMGIGINTGEAIVGNIGSEKRAKYGAVGSAINTAYRIESHTVGGQVLISPSTYARVHSLLHVRGTLEVHFKGLDRPVTIYDVNGLGGDYGLTLPTRSPETFVSLTPPLPIACFPVHGKAVADTPIAGHMIRLAASAAEVSLTEHVALHTNLRIILTPQAVSGLSEIYAKVLELHATDEGAMPTKVRLGFTSVPSDAKAFLEQQRTVAGSNGSE